MKLSVLLVVCILLLTYCSAYRPTHVSEDNGLKKLSLVQTPETNLLNEKVGLTAASGLKINTAYLFEEKAGARPQVTLDINIEKPQNGMHDSTVFISLDGENIQLFASDGRYLIPENLWVPIVHSHTIKYLLETNHDKLVLRLNEKQKYHLTEFLNKAIKYRDVIFPAIPPGKKKW